MSTIAEALERLRRGEGVWIRGAPGSGRSHTLRQIAEQWAGEVLWVRAAGLPWLSSLPETVLLCFDDADEGIGRDALPAGRPVLAAGARPGAGWSLLELPPLSEDESVRLFLTHAPEAGSLAMLSTLARRLSGNPTAIIAAARRWPAESLGSILERPSAEWAGLRPAYRALSGAERAALALLSRLPGPARHAGLVWCGHEAGAQGLVTSGWVTVSSPGVYALSSAIADCVRPWKEADVSPYFAWFAREARARFASWEAQGGSPAWFRSGLWPALHARGDHAGEGWFFQAWLLSGEAPEALLAALAASEGVLPGIIAARTAAQAKQRLGERQEAADILRAAVSRGDSERPRQLALAQLELAVADHRLRDTASAQAGYAAALRQLEALGLRRERVICLSNMAALAHAVGDREQARAGYQAAITEAAAINQVRTRCHLSCNLGSLLLEMDELDAAQAAFQQAVRQLSPERDARMLGVARSNQGVLELLRGHLDAADTRFAEAAALLGPVRPASAALCHARRGAVAALRGQVDIARQHHERADAAVPPGDPSTNRLISLWRAPLEWQVGDRRSALERRRASLHDAPALTATSGEARLAVLVLERLVARPGEVLLIGPGGRWFRGPGEKRVSVERSVTASRILGRLARAAEDEPGVFCSADDLIEAGWPGEKITTGAARNRLAVALAQLRKLGLRELLQRARGGWRLDPDLSVLLLQSDLPGEAGAE